MFDYKYRMLLTFSVFALLVGTAPSGEAQTVKRILSQFDKGNPGWKVRMTSLVRLANAGPAAVPALVDALKSDSDSTREFAVQAMGMFADPSARPALEQALKDPKLTVRIYAIRALRNLGPLKPAEQYETK